MGETISLLSRSLPHRCRRACGWGAGALRGTSAPHTASRPPHIPAWRSTFAGKCPGSRGRHRRSGKPWREGEAPPHTPPAQARPLGTASSQAHSPPAATNLPHLPVPSFVFRGRMPASYRSIHDSFIQQVFIEHQSARGPGLFSSWEVELTAPGQPTGAPTLHIPSPPDTLSLHQAFQTRQVALLPKKNLSSSLPTIPTPPNIRILGCHHFGAPPPPSR